MPSRSMENGLSDVGQTGIDRGSQPWEEGASLYKRNASVRTMQIEAPDTGTSIEAANVDRTSLESLSATEGAHVHRILLVEDELDSRMLVESAIAQTGFEGEVTSTMDANDALALIEDPEDMASFDLVLLDLRLPGRDGFVVLEAIRERAGPDELPVVVLTNETDPRVIERAYRSGANCWIRKPARFADLSQAIEGVVSFWITDRSR